MRYGIFILLGTVFMLYKVYKGYSFTDSVIKNAKYIKMGIYAFMGLSLYWYITKKPYDSYKLLRNANRMVKYLPIDKNSADILEPLFNMTKDESLMTNIFDNIHSENTSSSLSSSQPSFSIPSYGNTFETPQMKRMMNSGMNVNPTSSSRSVSQMKKKFVASRQKWHCDSCKNMLDHTFEVDHIQELQYGGTNHVDNLVALCRNCHGRKTAMAKI